MTFQKGHVVSDEVRRKLSQVLRGENHPLYGKHHSVETRKKISDSKIGDKNPMKRPEVRAKKSKSSMGKVPWNKGKKGIYSDEYREKISKGKMGKPSWNKGRCGTPGSFKSGHKHSMETLEKISKSRIGLNTGENNPSWRGGISFEPYCSKFNNQLKKKIRQRDNGTCQLCGIKENGRKLDVHHIHYDKPNCEPDLIALCQKCNCKVNHNRDYYESLFMNNLKERGLTW